MSEKAVQKIPGTDLIFVGYWDSCFFHQNLETGGIIVSDNGVQKYLTHREIRKIIKEAKCQKQKTNYQTTNAG